MPNDALALKKLNVLHLLGSHMLCGVSCGHWLAPKILIEVRLCYDHWSYTACCRLKLIRDYEWAKGHGALADQTVSKVFLLSSNYLMTSFCLFLEIIIQHSFDPSLTMASVTRCLWIVYHCTKIK